MTNSKRKCKRCKTYTTDFITHPGGTFCNNNECAIQFAMDNRSKGKKVIEKEERKRIKEKKQELRPRSWYLKEAQKWFNKFIRLRDKNEPCISCGRYHQGQYHAGHYRTVGSCPELRFEELNCHKQCAPCNNHLSGNIVNYRPNLINKIGINKVEWLEGKHEPLKLSIEDLKEMISKYKEECRKP